MSVLVFGGTGFVGKALQQQEPDWTYLGSRDVNLWDTDETYSYIESMQPDAVISLVGRVGGIKDNAEKQYSYFIDNLIPNFNLADSCYRAGMDRAMFALSTCMWPAKLDNYPFTAFDVFSGVPEATNFGYAMAKRSLMAQIITLRMQHDVNFTTFAPSNIYGPGDSLDPQKQHFVAALARKLVLNEGEPLQFLGTGKPMRQQLFAEDIAKLIPKLLADYHEGEPAIIAPDENLTIEEMVKIGIEVSGKDVEYHFTGNLDGVFRKDGDNTHMKEYIGDFEFTPFREGFEKTYSWMKKELEKKL